MLGIRNAWQLANQDARYMRQQFGVVIERTIKELNGLSCLSWDDVRQDKSEIFSTRSFGQRITEYNELRKALSSHADIIARKVRKQQSLIKRLLVFAASSPHDSHYYKRSIIYEFPSATDNTQQVNAAISLVLCKIYTAGVHYYRCGVGAIALEDSRYHQHDFFIENIDNPALMSCYDKLIKRYGTGTIQCANQGGSQKWQMRREFYHLDIPVSGAIFLKYSAKPFLKNEFC